MLEGTRSPTLNDQEPEMVAKNIDGISLHRSDAWLFHLVLLRKLSLMASVRQDCITAASSSDSGLERVSE